MLAGNRWLHRKSKGTGLPYCTAFGYKGG